MAETVYGFTERNAQRLLRGLNSGDGQSQQANSGPLNRAAGVWLFEATSTITAASGTTPGTGTAKVMWRSYLTGLVEAWQPSGVDVEESVYKTTPGVLAIGETFFGIRDNLGTIWVERCLSATRYRGQQVGALLVTDADNVVDNLVALNGVGFLTSVTVNNVLNWSADDNAPTYIEYNAEDDVWEMYNVECQS